MVEHHEDTSNRPSRFSIAPLNAALNSKTSRSSNGDLKPHSSNSALNSKTIHSSNGDFLKSSSIKLHNSTDEPSNPKAHITRLNSSAFFIKLPRLWLFSKRRFFIFFSFLFLLAMAFLAFPIVKVYPSLEHPFLVDLTEQMERTQVSKILEGTWDRASVSVQSRYPFLKDRHNHEVHYTDRFHEWRPPSQARDQRLPTQLSSPRYVPFWTQFRRSLHTWVQNKHYNPQIMKELLSMVKDPIDKHFINKPNHTVYVGKPYKTCAVVGNSGILLNQSHATFIDSHEMVMRLNNARIAGFEQYVGSKTTLSFVNSNILHTCARRTGCFCHPYGPDVPLIMYICQVVHLMDVAVCGSTQKAPIIVTDARFDTLCARIVKYYSLKKFVETTGQRLEDWSDAHEGTLFHYSSGMQAVLLAVGICEKVSLFGFGKSEAAKHHYHTNQRAELRLHDYAAEYAFYMDLAAQDVRLIPFLNEAGFSLPSVDIYWQ